jgi:hypothetical protein
MRRLGTVHQREFSEFPKDHEQSGLSRTSSRECRRSSNRPNHEATNKVQNQSSLAVLSPVQKRASGLPSRLLDSVADSPRCIVSPDWSLNARRQVSIYQNQFLVGDQSRDRSGFGSWFFYVQEMHVAAIVAGNDQVESSGKCAATRSPVAGESGEHFSCLQLPHI